MIGPESATVLQLIAQNRRILQTNAEIPAEVLRKMLLLCLEGAEELLLTLNTLEQATEELLRKRA